MSRQQVTRVVITNSARRWIGEAAHVLALAEGLAAEGVEVTLIVRRGHELERRARDAGLRVHALRFGSRFSPWGDLFDIFRLRRIIRAARAQVVHCHRGKDHWCAAMALLGMRRRPALFRTRHVVTPMRGHHFNQWLMHRATDLTIAVSEAARRSLSPIFGEENLIHTPVIGAAVDLERFHPKRRSATVRREMFGVGDDEMVVGLVGRIQRVKGQGVFIDAAKRLAERGVKAKFVIAGAERSEGRMDRLRDRVASLGLADRFVFLGEVDEVADLIAALDVGVVASLGSEGSSRVALEIMASEVPIVATRVGALPEIIRDGTSGVLCAPGDVEALADGIELLLRADDLRVEFADAARRHVEQWHSPDLWLGTIQRLYDKMIR